MEHAFPSIGSCANLLRALPALNVLRRLSSRLTPADARVLLPVVLVVVRHPDGLRMGALADELRVDQSVASRQFARAEAAGLTRRAEDPSDGRAQLLQATEAGTAWVDGVIESYAAALSQTLPDWSDAEVDDLTRMLVRLAATFVDEPASSTPIAIDLPTTHPDTDQRAPA